MKNRIDFIKCTDCGHNQTQDKAHPRTFLCAKCGNRFIYRLGITGYKIQSRSGKTPLPAEELKKGVGVREYPKTLARMARKGVRPVDVWEAGKLALDIS